MHIWAHALACPHDAPVDFIGACAFADFIKHKHLSHRNIWLVKGIEFHRFCDRLFHMSSLFGSLYRKFKRLIFFQGLGGLPRQFYLIHLMVDVLIDHWLWHANHRSHLITLSHKIGSFASSPLVRDHPPFSKREWRYSLVPSYWLSSYQVSVYLWNAYRRLIFDRVWHTANNFTYLPLIINTIDTCLMIIADHSIELEWFLNRARIAGLRFLKPGGTFASVI